MSDPATQTAGNLDSGSFDDAADAPGITYELDLQTPPLEASDTPQSQPAAGSQAIPPPAPPLATQQPTQEQMQEAIRQAQEAARTANTALAYTRPYLEALQQQQQNARAPKYRSIQELNADPNATPADLFELTQYQSQQQFAQMQSELASQAQRATSENLARGMFSATAVGAGNDFDAVRGRFLQPIYNQNPHAQQLFQQILPESPAVGEYLVGFLHEMYERAGGNANDGGQGIVNMVNGLRNAMAALRKDGRASQARVTQAAKDQAQRVLSTSQGNQTTVAGKKINAEDIWKLSNKEFDALDRQLTGGL